MSSFLSFPKTNITVFHQSLHENFPEVISYERFSLNSCVDFLKADILLFLRHSEFFPTNWRIYFLSRSMSAFSFPYFFPYFIVKPRLNSQSYGNNFI